MSRTDGTNPSARVPGGSRADRAPPIGGTGAKRLAGRGLLLLAALLATGARTAVAVTPANATSPLGINLNGVSYYSTEQPFMNVFVTNGGWVTHSQDTWDTREEQYLQLDANGYPKTLVAAPSDPHSPQLFDSVGIVVDRVPAPFLYPAGRYVVLYDGEGTLTYEFDARLVSSSRGRDVIEVAQPSDNNGIHLQITATDPRHDGNYIRNIRIVRETDKGTPRASPTKRACFRGIANAVRSRLARTRGRLHQAAL